MATFFYANDNYNSNLSAGFTAGETTMSVITVPANVPTLLCFGYGTDKECVYSITDKTTNSLTGVARVSGYAGNLDAQMTVACLNNEGFINQLSGVVSSPETLADNIYGADGGGTDAYEISLDSPPSAYVAGMFVLFKANTENTGACTLNVNALGAKAIKKNGSVDLGTKDILAGQIVGVVYDGTNFQLINGEGSSYAVDTDAATITFDRIHKTHTVTLAGNRILAVANFNVGQYMAIDLVQDGTGSRTVTWWDGIKWADDVEPTLTTTANKTDSFIFKCVGTGAYIGYIAGQNL